MLSSQAELLKQSEDSTKLNSHELALLQNLSDTDESDNLKDPTTHVFALHNMLLKKYGPDWIHWLPSTLWRQLALDGLVLDEHAASVPRVIKERILALQVALSTNRPWVEYEVFENVATAFSGDVPHPFTLEPRSAEECLLCMHCLNSIRHDERYEPEVLVYVASCFVHDGFVHVGPAPFMQQVQVYVDKLIYDHVLSMHTKKIFTKLWSARKTISTDQLMGTGDDPLKVQLRKLYGAYQYLEDHLGFAK